jgi:hypothetical protein
MKKLFLIGIPALLLATGAAYAADTTETWDQGRLCSINIFLCKEETCPNATVSFQPGTAQMNRDIVHIDPGALVKLKRAVRWIEQCQKFYDCTEARDKARERGGKRIRCPWPNGLIEDN